MPTEGIELQRGEVFRSQFDPAPEFTDPLTRKPKAVDVPEKKMFMTGDTANTSAGYRTTSIAATAMQYGGAGGHEKQLRPSGSLAGQCIGSCPRKSATKLSTSIDAAAAGDAERLRHLRTSAGVRAGR